MSLISEVADGLYRVQSEPGDPDVMCDTYLVVGQKMAVIETGPTTQAPAILKAVAELGHDEGPSYIIPTHIHLDHGGGAGYLAQQWPSARVVVHQQGARHLVDPSRMIQVYKQVWGDNFEQEHGPILPVPQGQLDIVQGGEVIQLGGKVLRVIYAPGHASHHICLHDAESNGLFCGDALGIYLPEIGIMMPALPAGIDLELVFETIAKLRTIDPAMLFFSHSGIGREVSRLSQEAEDNARAWADITLEALRAGMGREQIRERCAAYMAGIASARGKSVPPIEIYIDGLKPYFEKKGLI